MTKVITARVMQEYPAVFFGCKICDRNYYSHLVVAVFFLFFLSLYVFSTKGALGYETAPFPPL